jgi:DNA-binding MarR family transcriptional regulator
MSIEDPSPAEYVALAEIRYQIRRFLRFSEDAAREAGVEPHQHQALLALIGMPPNKPATVRALADRLQIRHHSAVELVDRLVAGGLALRAPDPKDHRQVLLSVTEKGLALVHELSLAHRIELRTVGPLLVQALNALLPDAPDFPDPSDLANLRSLDTPHHGGAG